MIFLSKVTTASCTRIGEQLNQAAARAQTNQRIATAITFLRANIHLNPTLEAIAEEAGLSPSRFGGLFKERTGIPLGQYVKLLKLEAARQLLENGFPTVREVMNKTGINDPSHFNRDFKSAYGVTPAKYRDYYPRSSDNLGFVG